MTRPTAIVSGLGPTGILSAALLARRGYRVIAVEKRTDYLRPIHLGLRQSFVDDIQRVLPSFVSALSDVICPVRSMERVAVHGDAMERSPERPWLVRSAGDPLGARLAAPPSWIARIDKLEAAFFQALLSLERATPHLTIVRPGLVDVASDGSRARVQVSSAGGGPAFKPFAMTPDLLVLAEGGRSVNARRLGLQSVKLSPPKHYINAHLSLNIGPSVLRMDVRSEAQDRGSVWAVGHDDAAMGTWLIAEAQGDRTGPGHIDRTILRRHVARLLRLQGQRNVDGKALDAELDAAISAGFMGTFCFEQQMLPNPSFGDNTVLVGDVAGMGHPALASGLEAGAWDLGPLDGLVSGASTLKACANNIREARIALLSMGMREYFPRVPEHCAPLVARALNAARDGTDGVQAFSQQLNTTLEERATA